MVYLNRDAWCPLRLFHSSFTMHLLLYISTFLLHTSAVNAAIPPKPVPPPSSAEIADFTGQSTFQQLIDHKNPHLGTFSQRYWWNSEWWSGEGSPVAQPIYHNSFSPEMIPLTSRGKLGGPVQSRRTGSWWFYRVFEEQIPDRRSRERNKRSSARVGT